MEWSVAVGASLVPRTPATPMDITRPWMLKTALTIPLLRYFSKVKLQTRSSPPTFEFLPQEKGKVTESQKKKKRKEKETLFPKGNRRKKKYSGSSLS